MEYREMLINEVEKVAKLHNELAYFIQKETNDDYFDFDNLDEVGINKHLETFINNPVRRIFISKENDVIAGFIACEIINCFLPISSVKKVGYISGVYLLPEFRGQGIMKKMEKLALNYFKSNALEFIELNFISKNSLARKSWECLGYKTFREQMRKRI